MPNDLDPFARVAYREGQLLTAHDLKAEKLYQDRLRWLHVVGLHATWGIVSGLSVSGSTGARTLTVEPGYAVDDQGRDILLSGPMIVALPDVMGPATLVLSVSYQADATFRRHSQWAQVCLGAGLGPRLEQAEFSWQPPMDLSFGAQVPLVKVEIVNGALLGQLDFRVRRYARREAAPVFGWGNTEPGQTGWTMQDQPQPPQEALKSFWLQARVDTSQAGFTQTPYYFAFLSGYGVNNPDRLWQDEGIKAVLAEGQESTAFLNHFGFIKDATAESFTYRILHRMEHSSIVPIDETQAEKLRWTIYWVGLEPVRDCPQLPWFQLLLPFLKESLGPGFAPVGFDHL
jgi:hypothetical protein